MAVYAQRGRVVAMCAAPGGVWLRGKGLRIFAGFVSAFFICAQALAWGATGHRLIGEMAEQQLDARSRHALHDLIGEQSLADVSVWLDQERLALRHQQPGSERWHYDNWPVCEPDNKIEEYCQDGNCDSRAYIRSLQLLRNHQAPPSERLNALRILVHVLEDIHQPLHAADHHDRGGNQIVARVGRRGRRVSLHSVWDTQLVDALVNRRPLYAVAHEWLALPAGDVAALETGDIHRWLRESHDISRAMTYGELPGFACLVDSPTEVLISAEYTEQATVVVRKQLLSAGIRLAAVLREAL